MLIMPSSKSLKSSMKKKRRLSRKARKSRTRKRLKIGGTVDPMTIFLSSMLKVLPEDMIPKITDYAKEPLTDATIRDAVRDYIAGGTSKKDIIFKHGEISKWDVSNVTNMSYMFMRPPSTNRSMSGMCQM